jgi:hypothetical protein
MKRTLLRTFAAAAAAAAFSASGFAITAAAQSDQQPTRAELVQRWAEAALDGQLKGMKTSLRLTADQEKLWDPFESAVKDGEKARVLALQKEQGNSLSPMDRLNAKAERLAQSQADLEKIVEAAEPLYASLSDAQKHKFITLGRMLVPERGRFVMEMKRLRVGEGDQHGAAPAAIGGKSAPSEAASTPATTTPGASGAAPAPSATASAPDAASPEANGATSVPGQAASTPATTTPGAASARDAAETAANAATAEPSGAASAPSTTTPAAIGVTESAPEAASPAASGATVEPSGTASAPTPTTPAAIGATSAPTGMESRPSGATAEPSGPTAAPSGTVSGHGATASATSGTTKAAKGATNHASVRHYANHYTYNSRRYGTAYGRNPVAVVVRGVFGGVADLGSLAAYPVYCFPHYGRCHVFVPY